MRKHKSLTSPPLRLLPLVCASLIVAACHVEAAEVVQHVTKRPVVVDVILVGGQPITAAVDVRTDDDRLWIRIDRDTATFYRPIPWHRINSVWHDENRYSVTEFRQVIAQFTSSRADYVANRPEAQPPDRASGKQTAASIPHAELVHRKLAKLPTAASIVVDAGVANWDADVEVDGVVVCVAVMDRFGNMVPARGTLNVELIADRRSRQKPQLPRNRPEPQRLGKWARTFQPEIDGRYCFQLPFQAVHPEFDATVAGYGLVNVRLAVSGSGVLEASVADVRIRPISQMRNEFERAFGSRFFPTESTGRSRAFLVR